MATRVRLERASEAGAVSIRGRRMVQTRETIFSSLSQRWPMIALYVGLSVIGFIYIFPFLWMAGSALKSPGEFFAQSLNILPTGDWHWENFTAAWDQANFARYFFNTVVITLGATFITLLLSSMASYALVKLRVPGKGLIVIGIALTFFLPQGYTTFLPVFQIIKHLGWFNTLWSVIVVSASENMIFAIFLFYGYFQTIPHEIEEAAIIDGATIFQRYSRVVVPLSGPMIATLALFNFMRNWNDFFTPLIFTAGNGNLRTLAVGMYQIMGDKSNDWTTICAAATISLLPIILLYILLQRYFIEAVSGAVKA